MRKIFILALALGAALVQAQEPVRGTMEMAFGWVKQADGTKKQVKGMKLDYIARPINAVTFTPLGGAQRLNAFQKLARGPKNPFQGGGAYRPGPYAAEIQAYRNEPVSEEGAIVSPEEFVNPSSLDDVILSGAGVNKAWKRMRFSIHVEAATSHQILVRWRIFDTTVDNPAGQMDYTDEIADLGGLMTPQDPSIGATWIYELPDISNWGVVVPDGECYMAQQFRDTSDLINGEGPFEVEYYNVYNKDSLPSIGTTSDGWIFDNYPLDGIYETGVNPGEFDVFSTTPPPYGNILWSIWVNGTSQSGSGIPTGISTSYGFYQSGNILSVFFNDTNTYNVLESFLGSRSDPNIGIDIVGGLPTQTPTSMRVQVDNKVIGQASVQKTYMWRYGGGTPGWVLINTTNTTAGVPVSLDILYGGAIPVAQFVGAGGEVKVRVVNFRSLTGDRRQCIQQLNRVSWVVTY